MENEQLLNIKDKDLVQTIKDYIDSKAVKMVIAKVKEDNWSIVATVPKPVKPGTP